MSLDRLRQVDRGSNVATRLPSHFSDNASAFAAIASLYTRPGMTVCDATYGKGVFWRNIDTSQFTRLFTDIVTDGVDMRELPYPDESIDLIVLDPPYRYNPRTATHPAGLDENYRVAVAPENILGVIDLYLDGAREAHRTLREGGFLVVKCQDTIQDGRQFWVHMALTQDIEEMGFALKDLAVVVGQSKRVRWKVQKHLDKTHSYFLVFRKGGLWPFGQVSSQARGG